MTKISILGASGRMGRTLIDAVSLDTKSELAGAYVRESAPLVGSPISAISGEYQGTQTLLPVTQLMSHTADVWIDFTLPEGLRSHLPQAVASGTAMVIGTTGLNADDMKAIENAAKHIPIVFSRNYSVGITVLAKMVADAARAFEDEDIEIFEAHHKHKVDAPSGTALMLGEAIADAKGWQHDEVARFERHQQTQAKSQQEIGYSVLRGGDIVGEHTAYFAIDGERLELTHKASSRMTFARGAVRAANWLVNKPAGLYSMEDVLFGAGKT